MADGDKVSVPLLDRVSDSDIERSEVAVMLAEAVFVTEPVTDEDTVKEVGGVQEADRLDVEDADAVRSRLNEADGLSLLIVEDGVGVTDASGDDVSVSPEDVAVLEAVTLEESEVVKEPLRVVLPEKDTCREEVAVAEMDSVSDAFDSVACTSEEFEPLMDPEMETVVTVRLGALGVGERVKRAERLDFETVGCVTDLDTSTEADFVWFGDLEYLGVTDPSVPDTLTLNTCEPMLPVEVRDVRERVDVADMGRVVVCEPDPRESDRVSDGDKVGEMLEGDAIFVAETE